MWFASSVNGEKDPGGRTSWQMIIINSTGAISSETVSGEDASLL
jgi:hypothetical protein